ncbi:CsgE family curli-type amyloid fiber assembly protein [Methylomicrobium lacus]|uniref:CsgE family curli-type amyloid fiber assembly protein n=1 Tax=Methylomicrobium lacus TaxID=136992 RepID=UPI0035A8E893
MTRRRLILGALLSALCLGTATLRAQEFTIEGLVVDQTISRVGHLFYDALVAGWEVPENAGVITVHERPDIFAGNIIWVEIDDTIVFQDRMGTRTTGIEEKAEAARHYLNAYIQMQKDSLQELEVY